MNPTKPGHAYAAEATDEREPQRQSTANPTSWRHRDLPEINPRPISPEIHRQRPERP